MYTSIVVCEHGAKSITAFSSSHPFEQHFVDHRIDLESQLPFPPASRGQVLRPQKWVAIAELRVGILVCRNVLVRVVKRTRVEG